MIMIVSTLIHLTNIKSLTSNSAEDFLIQRGASQCIEGKVVASTPFDKLLIYENYER